MMQQLIKKTKTRSCIEYLVVNIKNGHKFSQGIR